MAKFAKNIPTERLVVLHETFRQFPEHSAERRQEVRAAAEEYGLSEWTVRRQYRQWLQHDETKRSDKGEARIASTEGVTQWAMWIAAIQLATHNKKGHMCSTRRAIELLEDGIQIEGEEARLPAGKLKLSTANRWLQQLRIREGRKFRQLPPIHFRAEHSNEFWQVDVSPSDAKYFGERMRRDGKTPRLYGVTDDHSGVVYAEYKETLGEDPLAMLEVLYAAMAGKGDPSFPFQGIPECFYFDPGPLVRTPLLSLVLGEKLGSRVRVHCSDSATGKLKKASRAKGKIEVTFRLLKEDFESLFHIHRPQNVEEANQWLKQYLLTFNARKHPEPGFPHSRIDTWARGLPEKGYRAVCAKEVFWGYVAEPATHKVGADARLILADQTVYVLSPDLAGTTVSFWHGHDGEELYVKDEHGKVHGPYPVSLKPAVAGTFKRHPKTDQERMMEHILEMAAGLTIPQESIYADRRTNEQKNVVYHLRSTPFSGPDPFRAPPFQNVREFYQSFYEWFRQPFGTLPEEARKELEAAFQQNQDPRELWRRSQGILRRHKLVR